MNSKYFSLFVAAFCFLGAVAGTSLRADGPQGKLTIDDLYGNRLYAAKGIPSLQWAEDKNVLYSVEGKSLIETDASSGKRRTVVETYLDIDGYSFSSDKSKLLIFTNSKRVWRDNTKGDWWVLDLKGHTLRQLGAGFEPSEMMFAKFSPKGDRVAYVYKGNIYVESLIDGTILPLTSDGGGHIINGTSDWVYEEELGLRDCFRWSPDGRWIAFWQFDTEGTGVFNMIDNIDSIYPTVMELPYPKAGTQNSSVRIGAIPSTGGVVRWFDIPGDPRNNYLARMDFIPDSNEIIIQQLNRLQNLNIVWFGNVTDMSLKHVMEDSDPAWLDVNENVEWVDRGRSFVWMSERDDWRSLYKMTPIGAGVNYRITTGDFDVISVVKIDIKRGYVYFIASPHDATQRFLYRSNLNGKSAPERITPALERGQHSYSISYDGKYAIHRYSDSNTPPVYEIVSLPNHKRVRVLEDNAELKARYDALGYSPKEYFKVDVGGGLLLDAWMMKPRDFDASRKYPVIFYVYGEPASSTVGDVWSNNDLWARTLTEEGYVVMSVDPRGTNNPRGREWRKCIYRHVGDLAIEDHAKAVQRIEQTYSWVDRERVGVWGWSGGGSTTAHLMFKHPELYKVGIAVAGVYSQLLYDNIYQERYMGLPSENEEGYRVGSPINFADGLQGKLLLVHGTGDDNVHYQSTEMLVDELVRQGKMFSMMSYPMRSHGIYEREGTTVHLYRTMLAFWLANLPANSY